MRRTELIFLFALAGCGEPTSGLSIESIDRAASPCSDFYQYACGGWIESHPLPPDAGRIARFSDPFYAAVPRMREIVEKSSSSSSDPADRAIAQFHQACMAAPSGDNAREQLRAAVVALDQLENFEQLAVQAARQRRFGSGTFFRFGIEIDPGDSSRYIAAVGPGGAELPDRSYYLDADQANLRAQYREHIMSLSAHVLSTPIDADAAIRVETAIAEALPLKEEFRDPEARYHPMSPAALGELAPSFPWTTFLFESGFDGIEIIDVLDPDYLRALETLLGSTPFPDLVTYMKWQLIQDRSRMLDQRAIDIDFAFWRIFNGRTTQFSRDWTCFLETQDALEEQVSKRYTERFSDNHRVESTNELSRAVMRAFGARIDGAEWLDEETRSEAHSKLDNVAFTVGGSPFPPADDELEFDPGTYFELYTQLLARARDRERALLDRPVDRTKWGTSPLTNNAYYRPTMNSIGIGPLLLYSPFMVDDATKARNFGGIGSVIGHELTHAFDDSGRHYDRGGSLREWWTTLAEQNFVENASCIVEQFDAYEALPGEYVNGQLTLGENIADLGGLLAAYDALFEGGDPGEGGDGFDAAQVYFLAYAQTRCENVRPELVAANLVGDTHAPGRARVNLPLANMPEFADAFACPAGSSMVRAVPCTIW